MHSHSSLRRLPATSHAASPADNAMLVQYAGLASLIAIVATPIFWSISQGLDHIFRTINTALS